MEGLLKYTKTNENGEATYNGLKWMTKAGSFTPLTLKSGAIS